MLKWVLRIVGGGIIVLAGLFWWLMLSGANAPKTAPDLFPIADWRAAIAATAPEDRPLELRMLEVGTDVAPAFATQAGAFGGEWLTTYTSFQLVLPDGHIVVGGAVDAETAAGMVQSPDEAKFHADRYQEMTGAMLSADHVVITHEHLDHVMGIARHPDPAGLARTLRLNAPQKTALPRFAIGGELAAPLAVLPPSLSGETEMIAPGVIIAPAPGHTPGSQVVFVTVQNGQEYLLIGDIVWSMTNIADLKTRPVLTQLVVFDPNEDRTAVKQQVRALHDLVAAEPDLILLPSHDRRHLQALVARGALSEGFAP